MPDGPVGGGGLGTKIGSAFIEVGTSFIGFGDGLVSDITNSLTSRAFVIGNALESFGQAVFARFSVPLLAATGANIAQFQALDREIRTVLTLFGTAPSLVDESFGRLAEGIREVSREVGGLERDIGAGLYQTISAGIPEEDAFEFLNVAQAAAISDRTADLTTAVDGLSTVLNAFNLEASQTEEVSDALFQTVALGKTTFGELSQDIGRVAPLAANAGVEFQELFSVIGALTLQGLSTSESISFLRAAITGTLRPTEELTAIFQDLGFESAEAAIPVIGLQGAFQAITSAAGGSTSRLQELVGTSEGVSAILGVTGQNADTFARVLTGVQNSAGATSRAFEIMDDSVGRAFGRVTEAFDRLGNTFGELASTFAVPVLGVLASVIDGIADNFARLEPLVEGLGIAFAGLVSILNVPFIREIVTLFATLGITIFGLIGSAGLLALTLGKVISAGLQVRAVQIVWSGLSAVFDRVRGVSLLAGEAISKTVTAAAGRATQGKIGSAVGLWGRFLGLIGSGATSLLGSIATFGGLTLAIGGVTLAFSEFLRRREEITQALDVYGKQSDKLAESMGLLNNEWGQLNETAEETPSNFANFVDANRILLQQIETIKATSGELAAIDFAESILIEQILSGNAPEDLQRLQEFIERFAEFELGFDVENISSGTELTIELFEGVVSTIDTASESANILGEEVFLAGQNLTEAFKAARLTGNIDLFIEKLGELQGSLSPQEAQQVANGFIQGLESEFDDVDFNPFFTDENILDPQVFRDAIVREGLADEGDFSIPVPYELIPLPRTGGFTVPEELLQEGGLSVEQLQFASDYGLQVEEVKRLTGEGIDEFERLVSGIGAVFEDASTQAEEAFSTIRNSVLEQQPLLSVYEGAVEQTFAAWQAGQIRFRADLDRIDEARQKLVDQFGGDSGIVELFDQQPISEQAWLARLGPTNFQSAIDELQASYEAAFESGEIRVDQSAEDVLAGILGDIGTQYDELRLQALAAGAVTANAWEEQFARQADGWLTTAQLYVDNVERILAGVDTSVPAFQVPGFNLPGAQPGGSGGIPAGWTVTIEEVNFEGTATPEEPEESAQRFGGVLETLTTGSGVVGN